MILIEAKNNIKVKKSRGRPNKYLSDVKSRFNEIKEWLRLGLTDKEIADNLGIAKSTFVEYKKNFSDFSDLIKNERKAPIIEIKKAMFQKAVGFQYDEKKVIISELKLPIEAEEILNENGFKFLNSNKPQIIRTEITSKYSLPSEAAGLILLQHWDLDSKGKTKWSRDLASKEIKEAELEYKKKKLEEENW